MLVAAILIASSYVFDWAAQLFGFGVLLFCVVPMATIIVHLETTKALTHEEKSLWRQQLFSWWKHAANKRVTAFLGLYRVIKHDWPTEKAFALMRSVWEPDSVWSAFIADQKRIPPDLLISC